ncbi:2-hydroxychromene-2-carboxylate isomerase [Ramlibacter tataouinensis]|uniref:2-hydroxychromene-2-carboxylate isomerase n=1 Tax=Ramlibacter tataouinensis TaxID=94132 RepID=UPI0022F3832E|nr:2-hydroxychromene-2-carboxylate isomerase [Ramlibacter tataouinensis]WBY03321.1 2-hydroxychromene-2-carboxylate isomerase [Ramlibacter tataouinensis]
MSKSVDFYFDVGSPAAYLAWTQMPRIAAETGATVHHKPMLLGGVFQATGNRSPMEVPAKSRWLEQDLDRHAARYGVPFRLNPHFPIHTLTLMRGALGLQVRQPDRFRPYVDAVMRAIWVDGRNLNEPAEVAAVLQQAGFEPAALLALAQAPETKERLKAATQEAIDRGVFGAPTFFIGDQMFWGQDRLDFVKENLQ